jgi:hypothetical protein
VVDAASVDRVRVTFTRGDGRRYAVAIERERGPRLVPRDGPGFDEHMPHDIAHYLVEEQLGIRLGVFGQLAVGGGGLFVPAPADRTEADRRRVRRIAAEGRADMRRSEAAVGMCMAAWRRVPWTAGQDAVTPAERERVVRRIDEVAARWHALPPGGSLVFEWVSGSASAPSRRRAPR